MPLITSGSKNPMVDGRQSERALAVQAGVQRMMSAMNFSTLPEFTLRNGRRADILAVGPKGEIHIVEVKSSKEDFMADNKWEDYLQFCDAFYFATHSEVPAEIFPPEQGFILADQYGAEIIRPARENILAAATRKSLLLKATRNAFDRANRMVAYAHAKGLDIEESFED